MIRTGCQCGKSMVYTNLSKWLWTHVPFVTTRLPSNNRLRKRASVLRMTHVRAGMDDLAPTLKLVVAACISGGIGKDGQLPWRLKKDMEFFKKKTTETNDDDKKNVVVMGRKTWFSIPEKFRPLANRINIILSNTMSNPPPGAYLAKSLNEAISMVTGNGTLADNVEGVYIIGGSSVYKAAMESEFPCRIYLTRILSDFDCDTFLSEILPAVFTKNNDCDDVPKEKMTENGIDFVFEVYDKKPNKKPVC